VEITRGQVTDRPWGQTLGALGLRKLTGQLTLIAGDGKEYRVAFERGAVIGATSPLVTDSAVRIALTNHLITSSQVTQIARVIAAHPEQDEMDVLTKACALDQERALRLRQRITAQRSARTFSVETGDFIVDDLMTIPVATTAAVDIRAVVYLGVRMNLSEQRLVEDLRLLGSHFTLNHSAMDDLTQFGLTSSELPILEALRKGTTLPELEALHRELDPRSVQSVIYALVSCFACEATQPGPSAKPAPLSPRAIPASAEPFQPIVARPNANTIGVEGMFIKSIPRVSTGEQPLVVSRTASGTGTHPPPATAPDSTTSRDRPASRTTIPRPSRTRTAEHEDVTIAPPRTMTPRPTTQAPDRAIMFTPQTSSGELPGRTATPTKPPATTRSTTAAPTPPLPRTTTIPPTRASSPSEPRTPTGSFAHQPTPGPGPGPAVPRASTPANPTSPTEILDANASGSFASGSFTIEEASGSQRVLDPIAAAAEAFQRGQSALRDDQVELAITELSKAAELNPREFEYHATLAWAQFCGANDKPKIAEKVRKMLGHAIQKSLNPELPRFYLGRMERMLGRDREALRHFQEVLETQPRNAEAATEIRMIETRLAAGSAEKPGLGSLFGRKKP